MVEKAKRIFGYTDIHWSDRDEHALSLAESAQRHFKPDTTVIGGDLLNCGPFARHPKTKIDDDDELDYLDGELKPASAFLDRVQKHTKDKTIMLEGNHDEWFERWIRRTDGGLALRSLMPSRFLSRDRRNFTFVPFTKTKPGRLGGIFLHRELMVVHGWAAPKHAAEWHLQRAKPYSIIYHHTHRYDNRAATMANGELVEAMSAGCLCRHIPIYAHNGSPTEWTHGFWVAYVGKKSFTMYPIVIKRGSAVLPDGKEIRA
jgi:predicted phosphodiesterase